MAPNLSGVASADAARMEHIAELAVEFAMAHLKHLALTGTASLAEDLDTKQLVQLRDQRHGGLAGVLMRGLIASAQDGVCVLCVYARARVCARACVCVCVLCVCVACATRL